MPYMIYSAKRVVLDLDVIVQVTEMIRTLIPSSTPLTINEVYSIDDDGPRSLLVVLEAGIEKPQFIHLWRKEICPQIEAMELKFYPEDHRIRLDQYCRIDDFDPDIYYEPYIYR